MDFRSHFTIPEGITSLIFGAILVLAVVLALTAGKVSNTNMVKTAEKELPIYSVETKDKQVALTFNCAWNIDDLDDILNTLKKNEIKASFFMTGEWVDKYPEAVKTIYDAGHDLASHGNGHRHMNSLSKEECLAEIFEVHKKVYAITGEEMELFRPPYGEYNDTVIAATLESDYYPVQWSVDSLDWKNYGVEEMTKRILECNKLANGAIILMHNGTMYTALALQGIIDGLENKGYDFVPVSQLILRENYEIDVNGQQIKKVTGKK